MDYPTQQFIAAIRKFGEELRALKEGVSALHNDLQQQTTTIHEAAERLLQREHAEQQPRFELRAELHTPDTIESQRRLEERKHHRVQKWLAGATWAAFLAAAVYAGLTYRMLRAVQEQTRRQREAAVSTERAWVGLDEAVTIDVLEIMPRLKVQSHYGVKNFGHGPALKVVPSGWFWTDSKTLPQLAKSACDMAKAFTTGAVPHEPQVNNPGPMGYILFPSQIHGETIGSPGDPWQGAGEPDLKHFWFIGCIAYFDQFGTAHWTRFCMEPGLVSHRFDKDIPLRFCALYNDTDSVNQ